jgi:RNA polymerase sigma-70 factor (ECF subfamily)
VTRGALRRLEPDRLVDHVDRLYRAAWALCGNPHDAEDLVQETYARVLARPRLLRGDEVGYLLRALRNAHVSRLRRNGRRPVEVPLEHEVAAPRPETAYEARELFAAIAALPPHAAEAVVAVDVVGLSYAEAARALRVKEATLATRLHRARAAVARALEPEEARL